MKFILAPARKMKEYECGYSCTKPSFEKETSILFENLREYSPWELESLLRTNETLAHQAFIDIREFETGKKGAPALFAYYGLVYKNLNAAGLSKQALKRSEVMLRIISAFYGLLKPFDLIMPYRLEMQSRISINGENLYKFWGDKIYLELYKDENCVVNLASEEYAKVVRNFLRPSDRYIDIVFYSIVKGRNKIVTTDAKIARGQMARYILEKGVTEPEALKKFKLGGYEYMQRLSPPDKYIFIMA